MEDQDKILHVIAVNQVMEENPHATDNMEDFLFKVNKKFLNLKLDDFPRMCDIARIQNKIKFDTLRECGVTNGKFDSSHNVETFWSGDRTFMFDYDIPQELYSFMVVFVYKDFWTDNNAKIWRPFMKKLCARNSAMSYYDAMNLLIKIKQVYGANSDLSLTR